MAHARKGLDVIDDCWLSVESLAGRERGFELRLTPHSFERREHACLFAAYIGARAAAQVNLGSVFRRQEKWGEAITCFRRALDIEPDDLARAQAFADSLRGANFLEAN
ncbi:MAG: tetratricopeptide repeat protein, partial [Nitrospinae bacterium]|nr:tetratricopeptide repeat protein [Nitrospinota bacterium]